MDNRRQAALRITQRLQQTPDAVEHQVNALRMQRKQAFEQRIALHAHPSYGLLQRQPSRARLSLRLRRFSCPDPLGAALRL